MDDFGEQVPMRILQKLELSEESVRDHIIRPDNIREVTTGIEKRVFELHAEAAPPSGFFYRLNVDQLGRDLHDLLSVCLVGYSLQLRRYGKVLLEQQWNWAQTPADGTISWAADVPMHLASVSKLITAMAMTKLLDARGISHDARIGDWLPRYWSRGANVGRIAFRHLMTHTSGLNFKGDRTPSDFAFMKAQIARGTNDLVTFDYQNTNFGLCRILISTVNGSIATGITYNQFGLDLSDSFWDAVTIGAYRQYVSDNVFAPAGVSMPTLNHPSDDALAYTFPATGPGWNSGDLKTMSGGVGWHMSVNELLAVMSALRRQGKIMSVAKAETMLDSEFGLDLKKDTRLGRIYAKGGFWGDSGGRIEQSNAFFLPKGMELVVLANSPFCGPNGAFMDRVTASIEANVENILLNWNENCPVSFQRAFRTQGRFGSGVRNFAVSARHAKQCRRRVLVVRKIHSIDEQSVSPGFVDLIIIAEYFKAKPQVQVISFLDDFRCAPYVGAPSRARRTSPARIALPVMWRTQRRRCLLPRSPRRHG